jgi:hypothetical protein
VKCARAAGMICLALACLALPARSGETPISSYQVHLGPPPATVKEAQDTRGQREKQALAAMACGSELSFLNDAMKGSSGEDIVSKLLAKVDWLTLHGAAGACGFTLNIPTKTGNPLDPEFDPDKEYQSVPVYATAPPEYQFAPDAFNTRFITHFGLTCAPPIIRAALEATIGVRGGTGGKTKTPHEGGVLHFEPVPDPTNQHGYLGDGTKGSVGFRHL